MLGTLWIAYLVVYVIFTSPFASFSVVYIVGFVLPGILFAAWRVFEAMQSGGEFSVYYKVLGRWYFQLWGMMLLPCSVIANFGPEWIWIAITTMIIAPTIIWIFMDYWTEIGTMLVDYETYDSYKRAGRNIWVSDHELNWEERQQ